MRGKMSGWLKEESLKWTKVLLFFFLYRRSKRVIVTVSAILYQHRSNTLNA